MSRFDFLTLAGAATIAAAELLGEATRPAEAAPPSVASERDEPLATSRARDLATGATRDACRPLHPAIPEMMRMGAGEGVAADVPDVEDQSEAMAPFYEHLAQLVRGTAKDHLRIAVYGDSNATRDYMTGAMRRRLQAELGDGGHGYVALVKPWGWYSHMDVRHGDDGAWEGLNVTTQTTQDARYGHAFIAAHSMWSKSRTWVETADESAPTGKSVSQFDIAYVKGPWYGSFEAQVDGKTLAEVETSAPEFSAGFTKVVVPEGPHKLVLAVKTKAVQLLGASLERDRPGVVIDALGVGSLNCSSMLEGDAAIHDATLQRRGYDLVIVHIGTNLFFPDRVGPCFQKLIERHRHALPGVPLLVMTPPDFIGMINPPRTAGWMLETIEEMKKVARRTSTPLFDFFAAMGGNGSMARFHDAKMTGPGDWVHFNEKGGAYMGDRVLHALWKGFAAYVDAYPRAGCTTDTATETPR